uniref:Uncharacterized protein n=1 Tax=Parascaris equorum TaxID=6256 RepID=A0A914RS52_PAREQ
MELMLDFLQVTNKQAYDQLMDDIERVSFSLYFDVTFAARYYLTSDPTLLAVSGHQLFFGSSYYRGHLSANNDKAYVYLDRKGNRVKERFDVHRFKEYEFVPDAELDDMPFNLTAEVLRNEYESKLGLMLTQYRTSWWRDLSSLQ